ncbi:condensation domain-containing protein [Streptomyces tricolor]|nr:condensation domain-containing protein [Streptomyces tricolor]
MEGPSATYNVPLHLRLTGDLDTSALRAALHDLVERHESLRTVFPEQDGTPYQRILPVEEARPVVDVVPTTPDRLDDHVAAAARHTFDLTTEPPLRATLFALAPDEHVLLLLRTTSRATACRWDRWPTTCRWPTPRAGPAVPPTEEPLPVQYADYTLWQRQLLGEESDPDSLISRQIDHWRTTLRRPARATPAAHRPAPAPQSPDTRAPPCP